jgi:hypothetical protein
MDSGIILVGGFGQRYGLPSDFWAWYHRQIKQKGDPDLGQPEARELYQYWLKMESLMQKDIEQKSPTLASFQCQSFRYPSDQWLFLGESRFWFQFQEFFSEHFIPVYKYENIFGFAGYYR